MLTSKEIKDKLKKGVDSAIAARNKTRQRPRLAALALLPSNPDMLRALASHVRKARDHLQREAVKTREVHAQITKQKTEQYKHHGMTAGEKPGHWSYDPGFDQAKIVRLRDKAIENAKKAHAKSTEGTRVDTILALREVRGDLNTVDPLFHTPVAMLLRSTIGDGKRAQYARTLQGAGVVAIENAVLDAIMGTGNRALGAAICTILEQDDKLASRVKYKREEIADVLIHHEYWEAQTAIGLTRWFIESAETAVLELEGKSISSDRKMRAGIMKNELEKKVGLTFNEAGDEIDDEGEIVKTPAPSGGDDRASFYSNLETESKARDAAVVAAKRKQVAAAARAADKEITANLNLTEAEENLKYGGAAFAESMKS